MAFSVPQTLILPVETLNREFDGKLLLALCAAERGLNPLIGGQATMIGRIPSLPRSIFLSKGVRTGSRRIFTWLEKFGHTVAAVDEEALVPLAEELALLRVDPDCFQRVRVFFAWGDKNATLWKRSQWYRDAPVVVSGNPRTDLLRPDLQTFYAPEADELRKSFGEFVLLNTNFAMINHFLPNRTRFSIPRWAPRLEINQFRVDLMAYKRSLFDHFRAAVPVLAAAIAPARLVVRPHPSEDQQPWRQAAGGLGNITVVHEGPVVPWLLAARGLIHNGCTSAVEAAVVGTPALAFQPVRSDSFDGLPNALSESCPDIDTLVGRVRGLLHGEVVPFSADQSALLRQHLAGLDGRLCCERIVDGLLEHRDALAKAPGATWISRLTGRLGHLGRQTVFRAADVVQHGLGSSYRKHKYPGIQLASVEQRIERFRKLLHRFDELRARQVDIDLFAIERV